MRAYRTSIDSDNILRYDINGNPLGVFATNFPFGEQLVPAANGNILVTDFTRNVIAELDPNGVEIRALTGVGRSLRLLRARQRERSHLERQRRL